MRSFFSKVEEERRPLSKKVLSQVKQVLPQVKQVLLKLFYLAMIAFLLLFWLFGPR